MNDMSELDLRYYIRYYQSVFDKELCGRLVHEIQDNKWRKHSYSNPENGKEISYDNDLEVSNYSIDQKEQIHGSNELIRTVFDKYVSDLYNSKQESLFNINNNTNIRFNRYKPGTVMRSHVDHIHTIFDGEKKGVPVLTWLMCLNDDYEGGELLVSEFKFKMQAGDIIVFPSNFMFPHKINEITKGVRYSAVSWGW
jgi:predicted 2-oxoglutarate/Fe(II)-dependent dioxygenase YbiX